ncbi:MAG: serine/threonine protein kinase [Planctomycetes bacterium]|nr:serine/threonine protein kinase [Planctomycetota bacterium]
MLSESERQLARIAVQRRYLTGTQLCVCVESRRTSSEPLDKIFVDRGFLTREEVEELLRLSKDAPVAAPLFGDLLRERGLASELHIHEASELKARLATQNIHRFLGEILVERQVLSDGQVSALLEEQGKKNLECRGCGYRFNAVHGDGYKCPECGREIERVGESVAKPLPLTLREEIGSGPNGTVHRAFDEALHQELALKVLRPGRVPGDLARFAAQLRHPNIARTLEFETWNGAPCILSEFVDGIPLYDHVVGSVRLAYEDAIPILKQIAAALGAAHARGVAHGNLKARNAIVTDSREVKVTDFGLAPPRGEPASADLHLYLAPERLREGPSAASDLYACGVLWYFMLCGGQPFAAPNIKEIRRRHAELRPVPLAARVPGLGFGHDAIFLKLTFKEPMLRYRNAKALIDDLDRLENGEPPLAERELRKTRSH